MGARQDARRRCGAGGAASAARSSPSGAWDDLARRALIVVIERLGATRAHAEASEARLEALRVAVTGGGGARFDLVHRVGASAAGDSAARVWCASRAPVAPIADTACAAALLASQGVGAYGARVIACASETRQLMRSAERACPRARATMLLRAAGPEGGEDAPAAAAVLAVVGAGMVDVDARCCCEVGNTALALAALYGRQQVVRALLAAGASVRADNAHGHTPLMLAAWEGHAPVVELLLERGADAGQRSASGGTALLRASTASCVRLLLAAGANPEARNYAGWSPLMFAAVRGAPAPPSFPPSRCRTPPRVPPRERFLQPPAPVPGRRESRPGLALDLSDISLSHARSRTLPRARAGSATPGRAACVCALLEAGVAKDAVGPAGRTALEIARSRGHEECVRLLSGPSDAGGSVPPPRPALAGARTKAAHS